MEEIMKILECNITDLRDAVFSEPILINFGLEPVKKDSSNRLSELERKILADFYERHSKFFIVFEHMDNSDVLLLNNGGFLPKDFCYWKIINPEVLTYVRFPEESQSSFIPCTIFKNSSVEYIKIPDYIKWIASDAFKNAKLLKGIDLPYSIRLFGKSVFEGCESLEEIEIPSRVFSISEYMFSHCTNLKRVDLPEELDGIGKNAFDSCCNLESLEIPDGISYIKEDAFRGCDKIELVSSLNLEAVLQNKGYVNPAAEDYD